jgi:hypothetical protein
MSCPYWVTNAYKEQCFLVTTNSFTSKERSHLTPAPLFDMATSLNRYMDDPPTDQRLANRITSIGQGDRLRRRL